MNTEQLQMLLDAAAKAGDGASDLVVAYLVLEYFVSGVLALMGLGCIIYGVYRVARLFVAGADLTGDYPWDRLILWSAEALTEEGQELLASLIMEPYGDLVDGLELHGRQQSQRLPDRGRDARGRGAAIDRGTLRLVAVDGLGGT